MNNSAFRLTVQICNLEPASCNFAQPTPAIPNAPEPAAQALVCLDQSSPPVAAIDGAQLPVPDLLHKSRRNGRVACLPRLERDMVNRMLWNSVPYKNIIAALQEQRFQTLPTTHPTLSASGACF
jgi:hypothetical protein